MYAPDTLKESIERFYVIDKEPSVGTGNSAVYDCRIEESTIRFSTIDVLNKGRFHDCLRVIPDQLELNALGIS